MKMGKVSSDITFTSHFKKFDQAQVIANCERMANVYARRVFQTPEIMGVGAVASVGEVTGE